MAQVASRRWFYEFDLPWGGRTPSPGPETVHLHETRMAMMCEVIKARFGDRLGDIECLDLACHEGWFSFELGRLTRSVRGIDSSSYNIAGAQLIKRAQDHDNVTFIETDMLELEPSSTKPADFVLLYGLMYHLEDPMRALRVASSLCRDTLLIETQLPGLELTGKIEWGRHDSFRDIRGIFYLVDDQDNYEGGPTDMALVPSLAALRWALSRMGFARVELVPPPAGGAEQLVRGSRGVIAAYR
jgi:hypothetical protein